MAELLEASHGAPKWAQLRAAEIVAGTDEEILAVYTISRKGRSTLMTHKITKWLLCPPIYPMLIFGLPICIPYTCSLPRALASTVYVVTDQKVHKWVATHGDWLGTCCCAWSSFHTSGSVDLVDIDDIWLKVHNNGCEPGEQCCPKSQVVLKVPRSNDMVTEGFESNGNRHGDILGPMSHGRYGMAQLFVDRPADVAEFLKQCVATAKGKAAEASTTASAKDAAPADPDVVVKVGGGEPLEMKMVRA